MRITGQLLLSIFTGREQFTDCAKSWATCYGATGPAGPAQTRFSGGSDPTTGFEGGTGCLCYVATRPAETVCLLESAGHSNRNITNTGICSDLLFL